MTAPDPQLVQAAQQLLDDLTFGGHSWDGAAQFLARALADQRTEGHREGVQEGLRMAAARLRLWSSTLEAVADPPSFLVEP